MQKFKHLDFVKFKSPLDEDEKNQIFIVVDKDADDDSDRMDVMEIHQDIVVLCVNTIKKEEFVLHHRPNENEKEQIQKRNF